MFKDNSGQTPYTLLKGYTGSGFSVGRLSEVFYRSTIAKLKPKGIWGRVREVYGKLERKEQLYLLTITAPKPSSKSVVV